MATDPAKVTAATTSAPTVTAPTPAASASATSSTSAAPAVAWSSTPAAAPAPTVSATARLEIATALTAGILAHQGCYTNDEWAVRKALAITDALIAAALTPAPAAADPSSST